MRVERGRPPRLMRPPTVRVADAAGTVDEIGVLHGRRTPNIAPANGAARDAFLAALPPWLTREPGS